MGEKHAQTRGGYRRTDTRPRYGTHHSSSTRWNQGPGGVFGVDEASGGD